MPWHKILDAVGSGSIGTTGKGIGPAYDSLANIGRFVFSIVSGFIAVWIGISSLFIIAGAISLVTVLAFSPMLASKFRVAKG